MCYNAAIFTVYYSVIKKRKETKKKNKFEVTQQIKYCKIVCYMYILGNKMKIRPSGF